MAKASEMILEGRLHEEIIQWLDKYFTDNTMFNRTSWFYGIHCEVFLRFGSRRFLGETRQQLLSQRRGKANLARTVDLVNIAIDPHYQLLGIFPGILNLLETWADQHNMPLFVESVLHESLRWYFDRRGYIKQVNLYDLDIVANYYRLPQSDSAFHLHPTEEIE